MVWENVPGAFSSGKPKGADFAAVIEEIIKVDGALLGDYTMHSFGEYPKEENVSRLSQILEDLPHPKYSLSAKACAGILNRAERRGKKLPEQLEAALRAQSV